MSKRVLRGRLAGVLAIVGGVLIVASGFAVHGFMLTFLGLLEGNVSRFLPSDIAPLVVIMVQALSAIIALGGITVIFGGMTMLSGHVFSGRLLVALGGGTGLLGFLIAFGYSALTAGPLTLIAHAEYWAGVVMAVIARWLAKP